LRGHRLNILGDLPEMGRPLTQHLVRGRVAAPLVQRGAKGFEHRFRRLLAQLRQILLRSLAGEGELLQQIAGMRRRAGGILRTDREGLDLPSYLGVMGSARAPSVSILT
jgi:hypothetical protein